MAGPDQWLAPEMCSMPVAPQMLMEESKSDRDVLPAPKLLNVVLQSCKGRVDHCLPRYFELVFARVPRTDYRPLKDNLALVVRLILGNLERIRDAQNARWIAIVLWTPLSLHTTFATCFVSALLPFSFHHMSFFPP